MPTNKVTTMIPWPNPPQSKSQLMHDQQGETMRAMMRKPDDWEVVSHRYGGVKLSHTPTKGLVTIYFLPAEKRYECFISISDAGTGDDRWKDDIVHQQPQDAVDHTARIARDVMRRNYDALSEILKHL